MKSYLKNIRNHTAKHAKAGSRLDLTAEADPQCA